MNPKTLTVVAQIKAKPGKENETQQALQALLAPTRKEAGCVNYDLHVSPQNPTLFLFHENWASQADLDRHLQSPHIQAMFARVTELLAEAPQIALWQKVG